MSGLLSIGGIVSGLDTEGLLAKLEQAAQAPVTRMQQQRSLLQARLQAWADVNTRLLSIVESAKTLSNLSSSVTMSASSNVSAVSATASNTAAAGAYNFTVSQLATYHQLTSQTYADMDYTGLGNGTFTITANGKTTHIDVNNMTLSGLRDAINRQSDSGVQAMIVQDGGETPAYRLVLTSKTLGEAGAITTGTTLTGSTVPTMTELQEAKNAHLQFGTGDNAFTVMRGSNTLTDVIPGLTLNLSPDSAGKNVTVTVAPSYATVKQTLQSFASQYNAFLDYAKQLSSYDSDTGETGLLFGEQSLQQVVGQLGSLLTNPNSNLPADWHSIDQLGITTDSEGKLKIDDTVLSSALAAHPEEVARIFASTGMATHSTVSYVSSTTDTKQSSVSGYAIHVDRAASRAFLTYGTEMAASLGTAEELLINEVSISLTAGMSRDQVIAAINAKSSTTGVVAALTGPDGTGTGNHLTLTRTEYGALHHITTRSSVATGGTGMGTAVLTEATPGTGNTGAAGADVAGTINGMPAQGLGQLLTSSNGDSKGLQVRITGTATGDFGTMKFTRGLGAQIASSLGFITDSTNGMIKSTKDGLQKSVDRLTEQITDSSESATREIQRMRSQFNSMEVALGKLQTQSQQLNSLIAQLPTSSLSSSL